MNKRGVFFFIVDVLIAVLIFVTTIVVLANFFTPRNSIGGTNQYVQILQEDFFRQHIKDLNSDVWTSLPEKYRYEYDMRIDELMYRLYLNGDDAVAEQLFNDLTDFIPLQYGINYTIHEGSNSIERASIRTDKDSANIRLSRKTITVLVPKYCPSSFCKSTETEVLIWS